MSTSPNGLFVPPCVRTELALHEYLQPRVIMSQRHSVYTCACTLHGMSLHHYTEVELDDRDIIRTSIYLSRFPPV